MTCLICGQVFQTAREIPYNRCLVFPEHTSEIDREAFAGLGEILQVTVPAGTAAIGDRAFAQCKKLLAAVIPDSVTQIGAGAFEGCPAVCLIVSTGSAVEQYAKENGIPYRSVP